MNFKNKIKRSAVAIATAFLMLAVAVPAGHAQKGDQGVDNSVYQGANGRFYNSDKFAIDQVGGYYNGRFVPHWTYASQVQNQLNYGKHVHTYIYAQFSGRWQADQMLNYYLPRIKTPKGSIVALDVESGWPDTDSVLYALNRIRSAGYTPVLYGYKNFLINHLGYNGLLNISNQYPLWLAEYPDYSVRTTPNYNFFPSFNNVAIFQFTSTYAPGGLDGNIDLTGITDNGYTKNTRPTVSNPAPVKPQRPAVSSNTYTVRAGDSWWSIANRNGMSMYDLARINGKSIYSVIYPGQILHLKVQARPQAPRQTANSWRDNLGDVWHKEAGTFTSNTWINLRWGARQNSSLITTLAPNSVIRYDAYSNHNGYIWVRQPRQHGQYAYLVVRNARNHEPFGTFK